MDIAAFLSQCKQMLSNMEQANLDRSQLSAKPLGWALILVGLTLFIAGALYRAGIFGSDIGLHFNFASNMFLTGIAVITAGGFLLRSNIRLTATLKILITLTFSISHFMALWFNGAIAGMFLSVVIVSLHLIWSARTALVLALVTMGFAGVMILQDPRVQPLISIRVLISSTLILLIIQVLSRQISASYRKSLQVSENLSALVQNLDGQLDQKRHMLDMALRIDANSGLLNATGFDEVVKGRLATAANQVRHAVLCIKMKDIDLSYSLLSEGERKALLTIISQRIWHVAGSDGVVARAGRLDFLVLMMLEEGDGCNDDVQLAAILNFLGQPIQLRHHTIPCNTFIGVSVYPTNSFVASELRRQAEIAAKTALMSETLHILHFDPSIDSSLADRMKIVSGVTAAIELDQFVLEYQPVFELGYERFQKVEALIRWNHPELGRLPPGRFIPLMEPKQLVEITAWVLNTVNTQMKDWHARTGMRLAVAVNVPAPYLMDRMKHQHLLFNGLKSLDPDTGSLVFEITENSLFEAGEDGIHFLAKLRAQGVQIALDDFGTGFSNLRQLEVLPLDLLKIDKSLIDEISESERKMALCGYIIRLGHELGLKVVAEGIETERQRDAMIWAGCDSGQGYLFSKPLPADQVSALFGDNGYAVT